MRGEAGPRGVALSWPLGLQACDVVPDGTRDVPVRVPKLHQLSSALRALFLDPTFDRLDVLFVELEIARLGFVVTGGTGPGPYGERPTHPYKVRAPTVTCGVHRDGGARAARKSGRKLLRVGVPNTRRAATGGRRKALDLQGEAVQHDALAKHRRE